jgi:hypothetical protein
MRILISSWPTWLLSGEAAIGLMLGLSTETLCGSEDTVYDMLEREILSGYLLNIELLSPFRMKSLGSLSDPKVRRL